MKILVVEDERDQAELLKVILDHLGHKAYLAGGVEEGKALAELHPPDAAVLDLLVPGGGVSFLRWLRSRPESKATPVVIVTGLPHEQVADLDGLEPVDLLIKPADPDELLAAIEGMQRRQGEKP